MSVARGVGRSGKIAVYETPDDQMATGSTLGGPRAVCIIKANGALQKVYSTDLGQTLFGTMSLRFFDNRTGMRLEPQNTGRFILHPEHQEHVYTLPGEILVREDVFVLSTVLPGAGEPDPPGIYVTVDLHHTGSDPVSIDVYAFCDLRGKTTPDVLVKWSPSLHALVGVNKSATELARVFGATPPADTYEATLDVSKAVSQSSPGPLSGLTDASTEPLGILQHKITLAPDGHARLEYRLSFGSGSSEAVRNYRQCPLADEALTRTRSMYHEALQKSVVLTPDQSVNRGVLWAKANILRILIKSPTGWSFTNDPSRSDNSVGRDTAWMAFGADYILPEFTRDSLMAYVKNQEPSGKVVEYYNVRTGKTEDYGLNINDNTPLLILALWHHYNTTGDKEFLREVYDAAVKAARYILSQRNEQGLVWCTAKGTSDWGIVGWRNVIQDYRLSGATTEVNSECYAALKTISHMARTLGNHDESAEFIREADVLRDAINTNLLNPATGLYYLNIDLEGNPRSDVTSDLVFPVMFGVADDETAARIISRLTGNDFWTTAGMRTTSRDAHNYDPDGRGDGPYGLQGGIWVDVSFWFAFAAARYNPAFMAYALATTFSSYSNDPRRNNTVPGQFSEWLHGETLVNEGMMLSPWFPPKYLWAAIEGMGGLNVEEDQIRLEPRLAPDWKWLAVQNLPYRGKSLTWLVTLAPDMQLYTNFALPESGPSRLYAEDITPSVHAIGDQVSVIGFRDGGNLLIFVGSSSTRTTASSVRISEEIAGEYRLRIYRSLLGKWTDEGRISAERLDSGVNVEMEQHGFCLVQLEQEV